MPASSTCPGARGPVTGRAVPAGGGGRVGQAAKRSESGASGLLTTGGYRLSRGTSLGRPAARRVQVQHVSLWALGTRLPLLPVPPLQPQDTGDLVTALATSSNGNATQSWDPWGQGAR